MSTTTKERYIPANAEEITREGINAVVYHYAGKSGRPQAVAYRGKAVKPSFCYVYGNTEQRQQHTDAFFRDEEERARQRQEYAARRKAEQATMRSMTVERLAEILKSARLAAEAERNTEDDGTCNHDTATFPLAGARRKLIFDAAELAGVRVSISEWFHALTVFVHVGDGQANRKSRMAEAATRALKAAGLDAVTYCQMD